MSHLSGTHAPTDARTDRLLASATLLVMSVWLILLARLFYLQVFEGDRYRISSEKNSVRTHRVKATRGMILDRNGEILVDSRPSFDVLVVPHETADLGKALQRIATLTGLEEAELARRYGSPRGRARFQTVNVAKDLGRSALARVESRLWALPAATTWLSLRTRSARRRRRRWAASASLPCSRTSKGWPARSGWRPR